ncbi:anti-sigma factor [Chitinophaga pendula]|uniref:anti-sigma factor n=1 Tax=Chitinophaga TaxID=79328 RepID=UPI000BAF0036|nr:MULTISPECIES: anti-sigma factor [Chitinophaga]ASZ10196.1 hypothetical protein CK934_03970 [Chitinophaga sp. MD30]UCJ06847.1 anti-sigma factor [Chitinophaga pendula]
MSGTIESYVMGVADQQETAELEKLRLQYPEIQAAIESCERALEANARQNAIPITFDLKKNLLASLQNEFKPLVFQQTKEQKVGITPVGTPVKKLSAYRVMAAAAVALLVISIATNVLLYVQYKKVNDSYTVLLNGQHLLMADNKAHQQQVQNMYQHIRTISDPGMLKVMMPGIAGRENDLATIYWNTQTKEVYLFANSLPKAPEGKQYQLWALVDGKPVDAGMLDNCEDICQLKTTEKAQAFAITLENAGGSPTPTMDQMYVMGKVNS